MKKWLYFSTLIAAVIISIIISNSNLTLASEESNELNLTREFLQEATAYEENGLVVLKRERAVSTQSIQSEHIQDVVWLLPKEEYSSSDLLADIKSFTYSRGSGHKYEEEHDSSLSVKAYTTVYYTTSKQDILTYYSITSVQGGVDILDSWATISSQKLTIGQVGSRTFDQIAYYNLVHLSWSCIPPSTWLAVTDGDGMGTVGCFYEITIRRPNGYTWNLELSNNLFSNFTIDFN